MNSIYHARIIRPRPLYADEIWRKTAMPVHFGLLFDEISKPHDYRAVMVSKSSVLRGLFVSQSVQMFFADILPISIVLTCLKKLM